jgi:anti-sigma28 factor (negative regulator of flagellin synthesis)
MSFREVAGSGLPIDPIRGKKSPVQEKEKVAHREGKDRVELSDEARSLFEANQTQRLEEIRRKVSDGFYSQPEVTEKVADAIVKEFRKEAE